MRSLALVAKIHDQVQQRGRGWSTVRTSPKSGGGDNKPLPSKIVAPLASLTRPGVHRRDLRLAHPAHPGHRPHRRDPGTMPSRHTSASTSPPRVSLTERVPAAAPAARCHRLATRPGRRAGPARRQRIRRGAVNGVPYLSKASMSRCRSLPDSAVILRPSGTGRSTSDSAQRAKTLNVTHRPRHLPGRQPRGRAGRGPRDRRSPRRSHRRSGGHARSGWRAALRGSRRSRPA